MIRDADGRIARIRYVLPRHKAANWVGPGRSRKSTQQGASGGVELSPFEFLDRPAGAPETEARGSRAAHRSGDACGNANDRTILPSDRARRFFDASPWRRATSDKSPQA